MTESAEQSAVLSPAEQEDSQTEPSRAETSLSEEFEKHLDISQGVNSSGCSEETDSREKSEQEDRPLDGQTASAAEPSSGSKDWRPGSRCRAVYSGDGLIYPAVILRVKGQRCCVRYDEYNNEEEQEVSSLLNINEFLGPNRAAAAKGGVRRTGVGGSRREEKHAERGAERRSDDQHASSWVRERAGHQGKAEREEKKKDADTGTNHSFPFFPPFPSPLQSNSGESFAPPPPSSWAGGAKESAGVDSASSMLMLWYMCGFHTGSYLAQQAFRTSSKD